MPVNIKGSLDGGYHKIGIVTSWWNGEITGSLKRGAIRALLACGVDDENIISIEVPGAFEIPAACAALAELEEIQAIVALGCVIKGDTAHFEHVANAAIDGIMKVSLEVGLPITCGILTTYNYEQALARAGDDEENKGSEAALAALETANLIRAIREREMMSTSTTPTPTIQ